MTAVLLMLALPAAAQQLDADALWTALMTGNQQFVAGKLTYDDLETERTATKDKQSPPVAVLACADSRVPPELVFNQSIGGLFVVRAAGNIADTFSIASLEFAILNEWTKLIVVLGHENCGAVSSSLVTGDPKTPSLLALVTRIRSSFVGIPYDSASLEKATEANTRASAAQLLAASATIRDAVTSKKVKVIPAYYALGTGVVRRLE